MSKKTTEELENALGNIHVKNIAEYLSDGEEMIKDDKAFATYMHQLINQKKIKQQDIFLEADISERYGYKLLSEEKHTRQRDVILRICYVASFTLKETQKALKLYKMPELYARIPRDALIMAIFNERPGNIIEVNTLLKQHGFDVLRSSGVQE